jgi:PKD repeat protein
MKKTIKLFSIVAVLATLLFASCKKEENTPAPVASFNITSDDTLYVSETFSFSNTSTGADSYIWSFGDGTTSTAVSPTKSYTDYDFDNCIESFTITLTATKNGKTSTTSKNVVVYFCS